MYNLGLFFFLFLKKVFWYKIYFNLSSFLFCSKEIYLSLVFKVYMPIFWTIHFFYFFNVLDIYSSLQERNVRT